MISYARGALVRRLCLAPLVIGILFFSHCGRGIFDDPGEQTVVGGFSFSPTSGGARGGATLTLSMGAGNEVDATTSVLVGDLQCPNVAVASPNSISCTTPRHIAGSAEVKVRRTGKPSLVATEPYVFQSRLYALNQGSGSVYGYTIDPSSGDLTALEGNPVTSGTAPEWILAHPTLSVLYVANKDSSKIRTFAVDPATGELSSLGDVATENGSEILKPTGLVVHPTLPKLYAATLRTTPAIYRVFAYDIAETGTLTFAAVTNVQGTGHLGIDPMGRLLFQVEGSGIRTIKINEQGGLTSTELTTVSSPHSTVVSSDGVHLFATAVVGSGKVFPFTINYTDGKLTQLVGQDHGVGTSPQSIVVGPGLKTLYVGNNGSNNINALTIAIVGGNLNLSTLGSSVSTLTSPAGLGLDATGKFLYVSGTAIHKHVLDATGLPGEGTAAVSNVALQRLTLLE